MAKWWPPKFQLRSLLMAGVRQYRRYISPLSGPTCRYQPTCSQYALQALERHGSLLGGALALWRILRCNPWGGQGADPLPQDMNWGTFFYYIIGKNSKKPSE